MNRRHFIKSSAVLAAGARAGAGSLASAAAGTHISPRRKVRDIGIQLYTVRNEMLADPVGTLKKLAAVGFKELKSARSDMGNYYGLAPKEIRKITQDLGMKLRSGHVHVDNDWRRSGYHNHDSEFETVDGTVLYDILLKYTDPSLMTMEMDLGWVVAAGHDPFHYFSVYPGRFPHGLMDKVRKQSTEFGRGQVNIKGLLEHAKQSGMRYFFLEQEEYTHSAFESIRIDYDYLSKLDL